MLVCSCVHLCVCVFMCLKRRLKVYPNISVFQVLANIPNCGKLPLETLEIFQKINLKKSNFWLLNRFLHFPKLKTHIPDFRLPKSNIHWCKLQKKVKISQPTMSSGALPAGVPNTVHHRPSSPLVRSILLAELLPP